MYGGTVAGQQAMFDINLRRNSPQQYALLIATFYKALAADLPGQDMQSDVELMLCLLTDMKDMSGTWHRQHLASVWKQIVRAYPDITTVMYLVCRILASAPCADVVSSVFMIKHDRSAGSAC